MKIAIATDTNSGITAMEGEKLGVFVLAMPVNLEETIHYEGIDITSEQLYDAMRQHRDVSTSQPSPGQLMELWDGILAKGYDEIVYIPMSSGLSGSCQSAALFAQDYDSRVQVVDNHRISVTQKESVISALRLVEQSPPITAGISLISVLLPCFNISTAVQLKNALFTSTCNIFLSIISPRLL